MTRFGTRLFILVLLALLANPPALVAATNEATDFREVYDLIRAHATGVSDAELNRAAIQGFVSALAPKVSLATRTRPVDETGEPSPVDKTALFEGGIAYLRVARVNDGLAGQVSSTWKDWNSTNRLIGLVLDLRYADGADYAAAAATADLFAAKAGPLLNWGGGTVASHEKTNAIRVPVAVLVNRETAQAAEGLAAMLRQTGAGLLLGSRTAGQAMMTQDFPLRNGEQLRIATGPVLLGDGSALSAQGIKPDIEVSVSPETERAFFADAFVVLPKSNGVAGAKLSLTNQPEGTNLAARRGRMNEAELVREHRQAIDPGRDSNPGGPTARPAEPDKPAVNDPVLARGLDLLKGLAVVRRDR
jgi:C-terminal processing protease CtpA/Prc